MIRPNFCFLQNYLLNIVLYFHYVIEALINIDMRLINEKFNRKHKIING